MKLSDSGDNMINYADLRDEEIVALTRQGDDEAMDYLMNKYKKLVLRISSARFLLGGEQEDLIQEGMIGLYKAVRDYRADRNASFATFAALCIDRQISHAIETSLRMKNQPLNAYIPLTDDEWEAALLHSKESPESMVVNQEFTAEVLRAVREKLSAMERRVLELTIAGLDYQEIARKTGRTPKSVDNALQRIRRKVKTTVYKSNG
ncbi:MAG: sigma-70 family RNA polymerase sigma factor [Lachnospiraceae bacterium]|nr:sigma-70 family RNA polymerase sigma factor [Lachnospiraceae bacterium]